MSLYLGIEGGGTRTVALCSEDGSALRSRAEFGPANIRILNDDALRARFLEISALCPSPAAIGMGLAGARTGEDRARVRALAQTVWPGVPIAVTHDLEIALLAFQAAPGIPRVLVLSGTGSCCYGQDIGKGRATKLGGWGHLLGDVGSGYAIGLAAIRRAIYDLDRHRRWGPLGEAILRRTLQNEPNDLIGWIQQAPKAEIAALAVCAFDAAQARDCSAREVLEEARRGLVSDALLCARRLASPRQKVAFVLAGSVLLKQMGFARQLGRDLRQEWPGAIVQPLEREGAWGAVTLARNLAVEPSARVRPAPAAAPIYFPNFVPGTSPTEQRNPKSARFDRMSIGQSIELMLDEEASVASALLLEKRAIEKTVRLASTCLQSGGRIFYAGAGTSGRLGVLDASECPPTFRVSPDRVQGIMAGGQSALWQAVEGAEDNAQAGADTMRFRGVGPKDLLVGIAASGRTPFVWGALSASRAAGARTALLHFNPSLEIERSRRPDVVIAPNLGPEVLTGSTRLKCGTATKLVLNLISTLAMVRLGKVVSNLMVDLNPSNEKLRDRAVRIVQELSGCDRSRAEAALKQNGWVVKAAWQKLSKLSRKR